MLRLAALKSVLATKTRAKLSTPATAPKPAPHQSSTSTAHQALKSSAADLNKSGADIDEKTPLNDTLNVSNLSTVDIAEVMISRSG